MVTLCRLSRLLNDSFILNNSRKEILKRRLGHSLLRSHSFRRSSLFRNCGLQCGSTLYYDESSWKYSTLFPMLALGVGLSLAIKCENKLDEEEIVSPGLHLENLPVYRLEDVSKHSSFENGGIWVIYKHGVYDISNFVKKHPGGAKILLASGKSIEPFWALYAAHNHSEVHKMLEELRIGNLHSDDVASLLKNQRQQSGPYSNEPTRHPSLKVNSAEPFNAEPLPQLLGENYVTPSELFFVRNHLPVPDPSMETYTLKVGGIGVKELHFTLEELRTKFKPHTITTTIQCAGNRRAEMNQIRPVKGLSWDRTAISTAEWTGVFLSDVLKYCGIDENSPNNLHVHFEGMDKDIDGSSYGASIPFDSAMNPKNEVLLAFEMNGQPIPRDHGYPLRAIVPGTVGARNVKYLERVYASDTEHPCFWQQKDYKGFPPGVNYATPAFESQAGPSIQELPVQSAILEPVDGSTVEFSEDEDLKIQGYAWSGGGRGIIRVDVSIDGGKTWRVAELDEQGVNQRNNRAWAWTLWELNIDSQDLENLEFLDIRCKAIDSSYNNQPDSIEPIWNMRGVLNNAWHRVKVHLKQSDPDSS